MKNTEEILSIYLLGEIIVRLKEIPQEMIPCVVYLRADITVTYIYVFKSKGAVQMHERGVVISKCRVAHAFHCVTPSSCSAVGQEMSPPGDEQHLRSERASVLNMEALTECK